MSESKERADVIVIGMGPAGELVAGQLAEAGLEVIGIDRELVGGECPYWGCVPSKMMIRAAHLLAEARRIPGIAGKVEVTPDWGPVAARIRAEATDNWDDTVAVERFEGKGGRFVRGEGRVRGPGTVAVGDRTFHADRIVIATGTRAAVPPIRGLVDTPFWTNREAIEVDELPSSIIVLGGGAIGSELAQVYARFGVEVTIVEALDRLLPLEEPEAGAVLADVFSAEGITVHVGVAASSVSYQRNRFEVDLAGGTTLDADKLLVATGRCTDLSGLGVDSIGLDAAARFVDVDEHLRAPAEGVWAVGDITGKGAFTHVGMYQAAIVVADILGHDHEPASYAALPRVTFTDPEVGAVGLTEQQARKAGVEVRTALQRVPHTARGWLHKEGNDGFIKLIADRGAGTLVGATAAGPNGGEVLGLLSLAVHAQVPVAQLRTMIYAYPTFHRGIEDAVSQLDLS